MTEEETFLAKIARGWRVTIYEPIRESLELNIGDLLRVTVSLKKKMPPRALPTKTESEDSNRQLNERIQLLEGRLTDLLLRYKNEQELTQKLNERIQELETKPEDDVDQADVLEKEPEEEEPLREQEPAPTEEIRRKKIYRQIQHRNEMGLGPILSLNDITKETWTGDLNIEDDFTFDTEPEADALTEAKEDEPEEIGDEESPVLEEPKPAPEELEIVDQPNQEVTTITGAEEIVTFDVDVPEDEEAIMELCPKGLGKPLETLEICVMQDCEHFDKKRDEWPKCKYEWTQLEEDVDDDGFCPHHFDEVPEDLEECSVLNCDHYKRQYGDNPTRCVWPGFKKDAEK